MHSCGGIALTAVLYSARFAPAIAGPRIVVAARAVSMSFISIPPVLHHGEIQKDMETGQCITSVRSAIALRAGT